MAFPQGTPFITSNQRRDGVSVCPTVELPASSLFMSAQPQTLKTPRIDFPYGLTTASPRSRRPGIDELRLQTKRLHYLLLHRPDREIKERESEREREGGRQSERKSERGADTGD